MTNATTIPTDERDAFIRGAWLGMLFTGGMLSDNPTAPAEYDQHTAPEHRTKLRPSDADSLESDCDGFLNEPGIYDAIRRKAEAYGIESFEEAGTDFHFTRNGHGCGFWDGDWPMDGETLSAACKPYGSCELARGTEEDPDAETAYQGADGFFEVWS